MIEATPDQLADIARILAEHVPECEVSAFGSRVNGKAKPYSDLDLALRGPGRLGLARLGALREALEGSTLPYRVDLIDWHALSESFQKVIETECEVLQSPGLPRVPGLPADSGPPDEPGA